MSTGLDSALRRYNGLCYNLSTTKTYTVFDLEWNQSPQGKENSIEELPFEIIEIGAVKLGERFQMAAEYHRLISPQAYRQLHYKTSGVTHMDMKEFRKDGLDFKQVTEEFIAWCGDDHTLCTQGPMDLTELQRNMSYYHVEIPFKKPLFYYDVQKPHALLHGDIKVKPSLDTAVGRLDIKKEWPFHQALDDAYYTGKVMWRLDLVEAEPYLSVGYFRLSGDRAEEIYLEPPDYAKYASRTSENKGDALADKTVTDMLRRRCRRMLRKKVRWLLFNQKTYLYLAACPEHGFTRGKIRMKKSDDGRIYVVKIMKLVDDDGVRSVYEWEEEPKKRRNEKHKIKRAERRNHG